MSAPRPTHLLPASMLVAILGLSMAAVPAAAADKVVIVEAGDTLSQIALEQGVSVQRLVELNGLTDPGRIFPGQRLTVRIGTVPPGRQGDPGSTAHRVAAGENLTVIARRYGVSVAAIVAANQIRNPSYLRVGQQLTIPGGTSSPSAGPATTFSSAVPDSMRLLITQRDAIRRILTSEARAQGVPVAFALAVAWQESGWQQRVVSSAGAIGVMQLTPATADWIGGSLLGRTFDAHDATQNIRAGVCLLRHYLDRYHGNRSLVLAAYYQGQRAADLHGVYAVTRPYIASVLALEALFGG